MNIIQIISWIATATLPLAILIFIFAMGLYVFKNEFPFAPAKFAVALSGIGGVVQGVIDLLRPSLVLPLRNRMIEHSSLGLGIHPWVKFAFELGGLLIMALLFYLTWCILDAIHRPDRGWRKYWQRAARVAASFSRYALNKIRQANALDTQTGEV